MLPIPSLWHRYLVLCPGIYILAYCTYICLILYRARGALCIYIPLRSYTPIRRVCQRTRWRRREALFVFAPHSPPLI